MKVDESEIILDESNEYGAKDCPRLNQYNHEAIKIKNLAERIEENARQFALVEQEKRELDTTVAELKQAVLLRIEMDKCASSRTKNALSLEVKATYIFPNSLIISILVSNNSRFCLENWNLMVASSCISRTLAIEDSFDDQSKQLPAKPCIVSSKNFQLPPLTEGYQFETVLTIDSAFHDTNVLLNMTLLKTFFVDKQPRIIRIEMDPKILTSWDFINTSCLIFEPTHMRAQRVKRPVKAIIDKHCSNCFLPRKILFLLIGHNAEPTDLFDFLLPRSACMGYQTKFFGHVPWRDKAAEVEVAIEKQDTGLTVVMVSDSASVATDLLESLKAKILVAFSRIWSEPVELTGKQREYLMDYSTMESAWISLLKKFV